MDHQYGRSLSVLSTVEHAYAWASQAEKEDDNNVGEQSAELINSAVRQAAFGRNTSQKPDRRRGNGCPKVDADLFEALRELLAATPEDYGWSRPSWTRELLVRTLRQQTGVSISVSTVARMLAQLGARWGMAAAGIVSPWSKRRKTHHINKILKVVKNLKPREVAYYEDEVAQSRTCKYLLTIGAIAACSTNIQRTPFSKTVLEG